jgi:3'-phosphoadenosine 5'-phosphosulfate sulfotransferase (PAPS reductase)/FAD synthetase
MMDLFSEHTLEAAAPMPTDEPWIVAKEVIKGVMRQGYIAQIQVSGGKDSGCCVNLCLAAALELLTLEGITAPMEVVHADTGVESPVVRALADSELEKMKRFAALHKLALRVHVGKPALSSTYSVQVISGRALPPYPGLGHRNCTTDMKVVPSARITKAIKKESEKNDAKVILIIGTRADESAARTINTAARGESGRQIWYSPLGEPRLSPVLNWTLDDVWTYLGECAAGVHPSYSDFQDLMEFYSDAGASSCVIVADMKSAGNAKACGARGGCFICTAVSEDKSAHNMVEQNPEKYRYLVPLLAFRDYVANLQWHWSKRNFLGRTIDDAGNMAVKADQFSPATCEELLKYALYAQDRANRLGSPSRVQMVSLAQLIAIDFYWSVRAWHPPFHALKIWLDHEHGMGVRSIPKIQPHRPTPHPNLGTIHVGDGWDCDESGLRPSGLRDPLWEMQSDTCGPSLRRGSKGQIFLDIDEGDAFEVDSEGAAMFLDFEASELIEKWHRTDVDWTMAASLYLRFGVVTLASGQSSGIDNMLRRSQWLQKHDLHGDRSQAELRRRYKHLANAQEDLFGLLEEALTS